MIKEKPILKNVLLIILCALLIVCSICFGSHTASDPKTYEKTIAELDEKTADVAKMSVATLGMSTLIAAVPGDATTPIANYLVDLNSWLLIIIIVLTLEKYLLTIIGKAVFWLIIPMGLTLIGMSIPPKSQSLKMRGFNILLAGFLIWAIIPTGMVISRDIERTYSFSVSNVADETENIQNKAAEIEENDDSDGSDDKEDENVISGFISKAKDAVEDVVINPLEKKIAQAKKMVNTVVNAIIVLVITSCVIPLFTLIAFLLLIKVTFHLDLLGELNSVRLALVSGQKNALSKIKLKHKKS